MYNYFLKWTNLKERINPHAVRGYSFCAVSDSLLDKYPLKHPCDLTPRPTLAKDSDVLIVTFVNSAWVALAHNWICSAAKVGLKKNLYLVAFEDGVCSQLPADVPCFQHPGAHFQRTEFGQTEYQKLMIERTRIILKLLSGGHM